MLNLESIKPGDRLSGILPDAAVQVLLAEPYGPDALRLTYRAEGRPPEEQILYREAEARLDYAEQRARWSFEAEGDNFILGVEALRMKTASLFDPMMAVHASNVDPLPHQLMAVYEIMLEKQPLRFLLADDPGAGKTIMAGLLIQELILRGDARRVLVIAPGSLVNQWLDEMWEKFELRFEIFTGLKNQITATNPWETAELWVARRDQLAYNEDILHTLDSTRWDLVIVDEAHRCSANYFGKKINTTGRFRLIRDHIRDNTRHLLLMTATPHNGKEADFQLFLSLLDQDRFAGQFRDGVHKVDVNDIMRRMVKEDLVKFDGLPLFPQRKSYTVQYCLSPAEQVLYDAVTTYVREEMNRADKLDNDKRKGNIGFALTLLQRRLASSPRAIWQSLTRRHERLLKIREELIAARDGGDPAAPAWSDRVHELDEIWDNDDLDAGELEEMEDEVVDQATAAATVTELSAEILALEPLVKQALELYESGEDRKWDELSTLIQKTPQMQDANGRLRKLIIFTEHRDTLTYLHKRIATVFGRPEAVVVIHGGTGRKERLAAQEHFRHDPEVRVLVATDSAGEGINLQNANLMINYDLPWNPNRLEQRFGRIHRIGQREVCHLWNMVAAGTREGEVYQKLLEKLEAMSEAFQGKVYRILGDLFEETPLKDLLIEAIRYQNDPEVRAYMDRKLDETFDPSRVEDVIKKNALYSKAMSGEQIFLIRDEMEKAQARKLQPHYVGDYFRRAFAQVKGKLHRREGSRYQITRVPQEVIEQDRILVGRDRKSLNPVVEKYERVCFDREAIYSAAPDGQQALLLHPGHPLLRAVTELVLRRTAPALEQGTILMDTTETITEPTILFLYQHEVQEGDARVASRELQFLLITREGRVENAGWAPHLNLEPASPEVRQAAAPLLSEPWVADLAANPAVLEWIGKLSSEHFRRVKEVREAVVEKTDQAVYDRLTVEINHWQNMLAEETQKLASGKETGTTRANIARYGKTVDELKARLVSRREELAAMRMVKSGPHRILAAALVLPAGYTGQADVVQSSQDAAAKRQVERAAMDAVITAERTLGHTVRDVAADKCGWDITSWPSASLTEASVHLEVKGRQKGQTTITVSHNEIRTALNQEDQFVLAIVLVDGDAVEGPYYVHRPFRTEPDVGSNSVNYELDNLLDRAVSPESFWNNRKQP